MMPSPVNWSRLANIETGDRDLDEETETETEIERLSLVGLRPIPRP